jgi:hypothetical protein
MRSAKRIEKEKYVGVVGRREQHGVRMMNFDVARTPVFRNIRYKYDAGLAWQTP